MTSGYVEAMGIAVVEGRAFAPADALNPPVMVNQTMARTFYDDRSPIGRRVKPSGPAVANIPCYTIVGALKDVKQGGVDMKTGTEVYFNFDQRAAQNPAFNPGRERRAADVAAGGVAGGDDFTPRWRRWIRCCRWSSAVDGGRVRRDDRPAAPAGAAARAVRGAGAAARGDRRLRGAVVLVSERRREIGIRMALDADRGSVLRWCCHRG